MITSKPRWFCTLEHKIGKAECSESGIPHGHYYGPTALSADSTTLYLFVKGNANGQLTRMSARREQYQAQKSKFLILVISDLWLVKQVTIDN